MQPAAEKWVPTSDVPDAWQLTLNQPAQGYRFSLDAVLLADFVSSAAQGPVADLGTGCGVVALFLARRFPRLRLVGVELQSSLVRFAAQNVVENGLADRVSILQADIGQVPSLLPTSTFGTVVCNPPYRPIGQGRLSPNPEKAIARHELTVSLAQVLAAARHLLCRRGVLACIYHPSRLAELCMHLDVLHLRPSRMRFIHPKPQADASMVLVEAIRDGGDALTILSPLNVCDATGQYSTEMQDIFRMRNTRMRPLAGSK